MAKGVQNDHLKHFTENHKNIRLLGSSSFFNDIGSEMITPLLPFYIISLGGGGIALGLLSGLREGLSSLLKILGGWLSDITGKRKRYVFFGYLISTIFRFLLVFAGTWQQVITFVSLERSGKARDAPRDVIVSKSTRKKGHGFGFLQMMDSSGGVLGILILLFIFWQIVPDFQTIIFFGAIIGSLSLLPLFFVIEPQIKSSKKNLLKGISSLDKNLKFFIVVTSIFTLANFGLYMFLLVRAEQLAGNFIIPLAMYLLFTLCYAAFAVPSGNLSDKIGRKKVLFIGYFLFFALTIGFIFISNLIIFGILFGIYGIVYALTKPNQDALVSDLSGEMKGTAFGFYYFLTGIITIPAGIIAGALWNIGYSSMFFYLTIVTLISISLLFFVKEKKDGKG